MRVSLWVSEWVKEKGLEKNKEYIRIKRDILKNDSKQNLYPLVAKSQTDIQIYRQTERHTKEDTGPLHNGEGS